MPINIPRGTSNPTIDGIIESLPVYEMYHLGAQIDLYRQNRFSVRVRIIDPGIAGETRLERSKKAWRYLNSLSDDDQAHPSSSTLLTPEETRRSFANLECEDPVPSSP